MKLTKLLLAAIGATVLLGALLGSASATRIASSSQTLRMVFQRLHFNGIFGDITCIVTLEGSLHSRTITKTVGSLIGYITAASFGACAEGSATILRETLPWHLQYGGFSGTLPNINSLRANVVGFGFRIREPLATCLFRSEAGHPFVLTFVRETGTRVLTSAEVGGTIPGSCGAEGSYESDRVRPSVLGAATAITVTLV